MYNVELPFKCICQSIQIQYRFIIRKLLSNSYLYIISVLNNYAEPANILQNTLYLGACM